MELTLRKALQRKNRLASDIQKLKNQIRSNNVNTKEVILGKDGAEPKTIGNDRTISIDDLTAELSTSITKLINLKTEIAIANTKIYDKIYTMSEIKSSINFFREMPTEHGERSGYVRDGYEIHDAAIKAEDVSTKISSLEEQLETLQDEVDQYNATTKISVDL